MDALKQNIGRLGKSTAGSGKKDFAMRAISLAVAAQLAISMSTVAAFAETAEPISNNTIPLAQPAPSKLVQKIWNSLDLRRATKQNSAVKTGDAKVKASSAESDAVKLTSNETTSTANGVTSTGQQVFDTPAQSDAQKSTQIAENTPRTEAAPTEEKGVDATKQSAATVDDKASANTIAVEKPAVEKAAAEKPAVTNTASSKSDDEPFKLASALGMVSLPPGSVLSRVKAPTEGVAVVDNDEAQEVEETLKEEVMPLTEDGKMHAKAGARFPVVLASQVSSKTAKQGDPIKAHLKFDLKIGDKLVAHKGAVVNGHVNYVLRARTILHSLVSPERWYRNSGCLGLSFDEIINEKGEHLPLSALPSRQARIIKNKAEGRELGVNHNGQVVGPWSQQIRYKAIRIGLNAALAPAGVFSFGAMPVALGVLGAANPSFAFAKPVGLNVRHRRIKGFAWGFLSGVPGSWLIEDTTVKGQEAIVKPGDEFYAELVQEFTGEPASDAQLMPGASTKVRGQIMQAPKKSKKASGNVPSKQ